LLLKVDELFLVGGNLAEMKKVFLRALDQAGGSVNPEA